jgi:hypothetical protein
MSALKSLCSSVVEHFLGKEEVGSPILLKGSTNGFFRRSFLGILFLENFKRKIKEIN